MSDKENIVEEPTATGGEDVTQQAHATAGEGAGVQPDHAELTALLEDTRGKAD